MHSLEAGIIVSIATFFFFSFLLFTFSRETNISKEIIQKVENEKKDYMVGNEKDYNIELVLNIINIVLEGENNGNDEE